MFASKDELFTRPSGGYTIARSVRLRSSASGYFNMTPAGSPTSAQKYTQSFWMKRGTLGVYSYLYNCEPSDYSRVYFYTDDLLYFDFRISSASTSVASAQVFRDPSAWYHIVISVDTTQATSSNRVKVYVNGAQITLSGTYPAQNGNTVTNSANAQRIGSYITGTQPFDGYLTEINFVDGQQLTPSSFGSTNAITGVWQPAKYTGTYGTNGFYLNFSDNSNNTAATIGKDYSGNGNNWTPNNISVTAGATNDSLVDVPTLDGIDTGTGGQVRGNYAVWNPLTVQGSSITYSNANLAMNWNSSSWRTSPSTFSLTSGKWYAESEVTQLGSATAMIFGVSTVSGLSNGTSTNLGDWSGSIGIGKGTAGAIFVVQGSYPTAPQTIGSGDYNLVAIDCDNGKAWLGYYDSSVPSTTWYSSAGAATGNPATGANPTMTFTAGTEMVVAQGIYNTSTAYNANFGQRTWVGTCPSGFKALCTQNLPTSTITNGAAYMAATLYTGTGASLTVANTVGSTSFQPDWVWAKSRSAATDHALYDSVRGVQKQLESNNTDAETTETTGLTAFGSTGFTVGALAQMNTSAATYVAWQWKAGTTSSSNTNGSITSTVSAGATQGFSVVTYTGNATQGATVGHGLGVTPAMLIVKSRSQATSWVVQHQSAGTAPSKLLLESTQAVVSSAPEWNNAGGTPTAFNSTVFTIAGTGYSVNNSGITYVAYCFAAVAGYSAFGSYTGNGSTDGPFIYTGFRPRFLLIKNSSVSVDWVIEDTSRDTYNPAGAELEPDLANAETTGNNDLDILSNGFKPRRNSTFANGSGNTIIYAAFAEVPFKYALAR
jgi:hypothetical protein